MRSKGQLASVFRFTWIQNTKGKAFTFTTIILPILFFILCFALVFIPAWLKNDKKDEAKEETHVSRLYLISEAEGTEGLDQILSMVLPDAEVLVKDKDFDLEALSEETDAETVVLKLTESEDKLHGQFILPSFSKLKEKDLGVVSSMLETAVKQTRMTAAGLDDTQKALVLMPVSAQTKEAGKSADGMLKMLLKTIVPMVFTILFYCMAVMYGQSMGKTVVLEKNSRLMEMMLTAVKPGQLIAGKLLAMWIFSVVQFFLWIAGALLGVFAGDHLSKTLFSNYSSIFSTIKVLLTSDNQSALSAPAVIMAILTLILGFLFFCALAGIFCSLSSKPEELASSMGTYNLVLMICYLGTYMISMKNDQKLVDILCMIPFTAPFLLPTNVMLGTISLVKAVIGVALLLVSTGLVFAVTGFVYKETVFLKGMTVKQLLASLKNKKGREKMA